MSQIGKRIKNRRKELGISAEQLAERLGVSRSTIYRYEKGDIDKLPADFLAIIAKELNTSPSYLLGWTPDYAFPLPDSSDSIIVEHSSPLHHMEHLLEYMNLFSSTPKQLYELLNLFDILSPKNKIQLLQFAEELVNTQSKNFPPKDADM